MTRFVSRITRAASRHFDLAKALPQPLDDDRIGVLNGSSGGCCHDRKPTNSKHPNALKSRSLLVRSRFTPAR
jgi:hypothetical protein